MHTHIFYSFFFSIKCNKSVKKKKKKKTTSEGDPKKKKSRILFFFRDPPFSEVEAFLQMWKGCSRIYVFFFPLYSLIGDFWKAILKGLFIEPVWEISHILDFENRTYVFARKE